MESVSFFGLFAAADSVDYVLICLGSNGTCVHGTALPLFIVLFRSMIDSLEHFNMDPHKLSSRVSESKKRYDLFDICINGLKDKLDSIILKKTEDPASSGCFCVCLIESVHAHLEPARMVETSTASPMAEADITAMKETLRAQKTLLQQVHAELDQKREASTTAASKAMDMILRLQSEKAAVKMEASHYKRMAEEKIGHAEETLEVFEELMYQKEMETTALEFQVLAYKQKLLALGVDINISELEFPDDLLLNRSEQNGEDDQSSSKRRLQSLPPICSMRCNFRSSLTLVLLY
ncbi:hypothetical protein Ahy_B03g064762 isoform A [Arachis hypogaea]|uniref:GTD-binding domain-containing protein n=2 Tax=Arachis hypogaea TaxID=3818 RepID=A0A445A0A4_ARAHY|nr:hypothetical protein Ahy_B03g064762 isoform A [Arachis hypogaea]